VVNLEMIPSGIYRNILGTPMGFKVPRLVSKDMDADYDQLKYGGGYDRAWILNKKEKGELSFAASAWIRARLLIQPQYISLGLNKGTEKVEMGIKLLATGCWLLATGRTLHIKYIVEPNKVISQSKIIIKNGCDCKIPHPFLNFHFRHLGRLFASCHLPAASSQFLPPKIFIVAP